jgi:glycosyltransferase involved in cell wall biosynthesis
MKILLAVTSTALSYGGPAVSVVGLAQALVQAGHSVAIWSPGDASQAPRSIPLYSEDGLQFHCRSLTECLRQFGRPNVIHDNGLWLWHHIELARVAVRLQIPRIVSPRGALVPWARAHKRFKKTVAWHFYQRRALATAVALHATSSEEGEHLRALRLQVPIFTIPNGLDPIDSGTVQSPGQENRPASAVRTALYLGRLYPVKGLPHLLDAWAMLRPPFWRLMLAGPDEAGHRAQLERQAARLGISDDIQFHQPVAGAAKTSLFRQADLFVMPSLSESFGQSIAEALQHGVAVLTTTATPWAVIHERQLGWYVPPTAEALAGALREATALEESERRAMGSRAAAFMELNFAWTHLVNSYVDMYEQTIRQMSSQPVASAVC